MSTYVFFRDAISLSLSLSLSVSLSLSIYLSIWSTLYLVSTAEFEVIKGKRFLVFGICDEAVSVSSVSFYSDDGFQPMQKELYNNNDKKTE